MGFCESSLCAYTRICIFQWDFLEACADCIKDPKFTWEIDPEMYEDEAKEQFTKILKTIEKLTL